MTRLGTSKLIHRGFEYIKNRVSNDITHWRCDKNRLRQCKGKCRTIKYGSKEMVIAYGTHNHPPTEPLILKLKHRQIES